MIKVDEEVEVFLMKFALDGLGMSSHVEKDKVKVRGSKKNGAKST